MPRRGGDQSKVGETGDAGEVPRVERRRDVAGADEESIRFAERGLSSCGVGACVLEVHVERGVQRAPRKTIWNLWCQAGESSNPHARVIATVAHHHGARREQIGHALQDGDVRRGNNRS